MSTSAERVAEFWDCFVRDMPGKATSMVEGGYIDAKLKDPKGTSVLVYACSRGWSDLVKALLDKGAVADERNEDDQGPLFVACMAGKGATVRHLIKAGVSPSKPFCKEEKVPPIVAAASRGALPCIHELLNAGAWLDEADAQGHTALHTACFMGSPQVAIFLIERGANVNLRSKKGCTPLAWAASKGHTDVVKALLDKGADITGAGTGEVLAPSEIDLIPLLGAARANRVDAIKLLLDRKADINMRAPYGKGLSALHCAAIGDAKQACLELLKRGADFGAVTNEAKTVIELAGEAGSVATNELLVSWEQHGGEAPPEEKAVEEPVKWQPDFSKVDPVYFKLASWMGEAQALVTAATKNEYSVCRSLLEGGTDPNCAMKMSPLAAACKEGHARIVKLMLMSGADPTKQSSKKTPLEWAQEEAVRDPHKDELEEEADALLRQASSRPTPGVAAKAGDSSKTASKQPEKPKESKEDRAKRYAETIKIIENPHLCACCGEAFPPTKLKRCGKCKKVKYCSVDCQKKGWVRFHKMQCNIWAERIDMLLHRDDPKPAQVEVPHSVENVDEPKPDWMK